MVSQRRPTHILPRSSGRMGPHWQGRLWTQHPITRLHFRYARLAAYLRSLCSRGSTEAFFYPTQPRSPSVVLRVMGNTAYLGNTMLNSAIEWLDAPGLAHTCLDCARRVARKHDGTLIKEVTFDT